MAFVENLERDLRARVQEREHVWAKRFATGLQHSHSPDEDFLPDGVIARMRSEPYWREQVSTRRQMQRDERELIEQSGHAYIPGIPDEIVEKHIWPRFAKSFREISACQHNQKKLVLSTFFSIRLLNRRWEHLVNFSYEWGVYRMVRRDFNEGWIWYSYFPSMRGPYTELSRMMDLLPDPSCPEVSPQLHKSMGVLATSDLWEWQSFLNVNRKLRYDDRLHCGKAGDGFVLAIQPCYDCIFYPRSADPLVGPEPEGARLEAISERYISDNEWDEEAYRRYCRRHPVGLGGPRRRRCHSI